MPLEVEGGPTLKQSRKRLVVHAASGQLAYVKDLKGIDSVEQAVEAGMADAFVVPIPTDEHLLLLTT